MKRLNQFIDQYTAWDLQPTWICQFQNKGFFQRKLLKMKRRLPWSFFMLYRAWESYLFYWIIQPQQLLYGTEIFGGVAKMGWTLLSRRPDALDFVRPDRPRFRGLLLVFLIGFFLAISFYFSNSAKIIYNNTLHSFEPDIRTL